MTTVAFVLLVLSVGGPLCGHQFVLPALARSVARAARARRRQR
ncbi:hypothetical protein ACGFZS_09720 [Streptomyces sp. NPDC048288]